MIELGTRNFTIIEWERKRAMNRKRLKKLKYMLENHVTIFPKVRFGMRSWAKAADNNGICKTSACALGSAASYPDFIKEGLHLQGREYIKVKFKSTTGFRAGSHFFSINHQDSHYLFNPEYYKTKDGWNKRRITRKDVIERIDEILERK